MSNNPVLNVQNGMGYDSVSNCAVDSRRDCIVWDSAALWNKALIHVLFLLQILKANRRGKNIVNRCMFEGFIQQSVQCRIARIYLLRLQMLSHTKTPPPFLKNSSSGQFIE